MRQDAVLQLVVALAGTGEALARHFRDDMRRVWIAPLPCQSGDALDFAPGPSYIGVRLEDARNDQRTFHRVVVAFEKPLQVALERQVRQPTVVAHNATAACSRAAAKRISGQRSSVRLRLVRLDAR